jgi:hypothetical protein
MPPDRHDVLLRKSRQDELVLERLLGDSDVDDDTLGRLTPFGTVFRYDEVLQKAGKDRSLWLGWIRALRAFVESHRP